MTAARDHIRKAEDCLATPGMTTTRPVLHALLSIAYTLADMADQEADTKPQPAYTPVDPSHRIDMGAHYADRARSTVRDVDLASPADGKNP